MIRLHQQKMAQTIVEGMKKDKMPTLTEVVESGGLTRTTARAHAKRTLEAKGVQEALKEYGFDIDSAKKVVARILNKGKEENQLRAASEIFKVHGAYAPDRVIVADLEKIAERQELLKKLVCEHNEPVEHGEI